MATAIKKTVDVEIKKVEKRDEVQLTLTIEEATALRNVLGQTSWIINRDLGLSDVYRALDGIGLAYMSLGGICIRRGT